MIIKKDFYIGIDIGGTKTFVVLSDGERIVKEFKFYNPFVFQDLKLKIKSFIEGLICDYHVLTIGVAAAGLVEENCLIYGPNLGNKKKVDFSSWWPSVPVYVANDAYLFSYYHLKCNREIKDKNFFSLVLGTGVGRSLVKNGELQKIKLLEISESWKDRYQFEKDSYKYDSLAVLISKKAKDFLKKYKVNNLIVSGGLIKNKEFKSKLKERLQPLNFVFSTLSDRQTALGALIYAKNKKEKND